MKKTVLMLAVLVSCATVHAGDSPRKLDVVGVSVSSLANPYFSALARGAQARAEEINPRVRVIVTSAEYDVPAQVREIERFVSERADLILIAASHSTALASALRRARDAGIPVVAVDVDTEGAEVMIQSDNRSAGESVCRYLAGRLNGKGNFIIQNGPQVSSVTDRVAGCRAALKDFPNIRLLTDTGDGLASPWGGSHLMEEHVQRFPQIDAIFAINDRQALGAETVAVRRGMRKLLIGGVDGSPEVEDALKRPGLIVVSAAQSPEEIGRRGVDSGLALRDGRGAERGRILLQTNLVTRDNVAKYQGWNAR
ncbi:substrate-binding domain-containing protein [Niveibacterium sp.]|uniref:substrate-binding domain-containing protein n=1 Tax=Niveibacterium sp. TaxID=2017444 RepID=UPI0035AEBCC8